MDCLTPIELLQPLPIPNKIWDNIIDFVEGLLKLKRFDTIIIECMNKNAHFSTLSHLFIAPYIAQSLAHDIICLHDTSSFCLQGT